MIVASSRCDTCCFHNVASPLINRPVPSSNRRRKAWNPDGSSIAVTRDAAAVAASIEHTDNVERAERNIIFIAGLLLRITLREAPCEVVKAVCMFDENHARVWTSCASAPPQHVDGPPTAPGSHSR